MAKILALIQVLPKDFPDNVPFITETVVIAGTEEKTLNPLNEDSYNLVLTLRDVLCNTDLNLRGTADLLADNMKGI